MKGYNKVVVYQTAVAAAILAIVNIMSGIPAGWLTWALALPAWLIIAITTLARAKDITANGKRWQVRRASMTLAGASCMALAAAPVLGYSNAFPTWYMVLAFWGITGILVTSPHQPPWWAYINGDWKLKKGQQI